MTIHIANDWEIPQIYQNKQKQNHPKRRDFKKGRNAYNIKWTERSIQEQTWKAFRLAISNLMMSFAREMFVTPWGQKSEHSGLGREQVVAKGNRV